MKKRDLLSLEDWSKSDINHVILTAQKLKRYKNRCQDYLKCKTLLMLFAKPSLRTHLSFDVAMYQLGGHAIFYDLDNSTLGKKESIKDFAKVIARYADVIMARLYDHNQIEEIAKYADVPIINGLTDYYHPCQVLGDFLTIKEKLGRVSGKKIAFLGDANNNVTHSLILEGNRTGTEIIVSCPDKKEYLPNPKVIAKGKYKYVKDPKKAAKMADVIYTDSWMSYQIKKSGEKRRARQLKPYQVNGKLFNVNKKAIFIQKKKKKRGHEVTDEVMDSNRSVVYQQAENRMWSEKAILLKCLGVKP